MKIIGTDNHANEAIADILHSAGYNDIDEAQKICDDLNRFLGDKPGYWYRIVDDNYRLWRGVEDLV